MPSSRIDNYGNVQLGSLLENGHTVQLRLPKNEEGQPTVPIPTIEGGGLLDWTVPFYWITSIFIGAVTRLTAINISSTVDRKLSILDDMTSRHCPVSLNINRGLVLSTTLGECSWPLLRTCKNKQILNFLLPILYTTK